MTTLADLKQLSHAELDALERNIAAARQHLKENAARELKSKLKALAEEAGLTLSELLEEASGKATKGKGDKSAPKYRHPENPTVTWSGRGRQPAWYAAYLERHGKAKTEADLAL